MAEKKTTKETRPIPSEILKALAPLTEAERKKFKVTPDELKRGKQGRW